MRVLSLGAGVQSSTLLLMACEGEVALDRAVFADTQWEPSAVYTWLGSLEAIAGCAGIPVHRVTAGNLRADALDTGHRFASMPLHTVDVDGTVGMVRRQCTKEYKVRPIQILLRQMGATATRPVDLLLGISTDEAIRMRDSRVQYVRNCYPLIDLGMSRSDCLRWLDQHGYPEPPKSSCIGCPYRSNALWLSLPPEEWADAVDFDARIRHTPRLTGTAYLHRQCVPLPMADNRSKQQRARDGGQISMFGDECDGHCGV